MLHGGASASAASVRANCSDDTIKVLNLAHDWLSTLLPFALTKTSRVTFGVLNQSDLERALDPVQGGDPLMPKTRRLLAVPFVGKDVPSAASEYAHPDVLIGLTILAYRYQGLRYIPDAKRTDRKSVV